MILNEAEGFKFSGLNKEVALTRNFKTAAVWLRSNVAKNEIQKIKQKDTEGMTPSDLSNYLLSLHISRKVAGNKRLKQETRDAASKLLKNVGIDITSIKEDDAKILKNARLTFEKIHQESNQKPEEKENGQEETKSKQEKVTARTTGTTETGTESGESEPGQPAEKSSEEEIKKQIAAEIEPEKLRSPKETSQEIKKLKQNSAAQMQEIINGLQTSQDIAAKMNSAKVNAILAKFNRRMNGLETKALAGPRNARDALNMAQAEAAVQLNNAKRATLKGAVRRGIGRSEEALKSAGEKISKISQRAKQFSKESETAEKIRSAVGKAKEKIKTGAEGALEKTISSVEKSNVQRGYNLIKKHIGEAEAEKFLKDPRANIELLNRAEEEQKKTRKSLKDVIETGKKKATELPRETFEKIKKRIPKLPDKNIF